MALIGEMQYLTIGGSTYSIPTGTTVEVERNLTSGTKSATIKVDGTSYDLYAPTSNAGTVTSVRVQATSPVQSSTSTAQSSSLNTTISLANGYGDTKNPYGTKIKNYVLAGPTTGNDAAPTFRALVAADIPDLSGTYLTSYTETDPVYSVSVAAGITATDISNWNAKADSDVNVTNTAVTAATTYYLTGSTSSSTATGGLSKHAAIKAYVTANSGTGGSARIDLGNTTATTSAGGKEGIIRLYGTSATYYVELKAGAPSANRTISFPNKAGTVALTDDIPTVPSSTGSATTGVTIADHSSTTIYGVQSSTTSVIGVSGSTTASKVTIGSSSTDYGITAAGSGSATLTFTMDTTDTKKLKVTFSHTHTAPTLGSKVPAVSASDVTVPIAASSATTIPIKNASTTTVITSKTHSVTDNGHTHTI